MLFRQEFSFRLLKNVRAKRAKVSERSELRCVVDSGDACGDTQKNAFGDTHINAFGDTHTNAFGDTHINAFGDTHITHLGLDTHISEVHGAFQLQLVHHLKKKKLMQDSTRQPVPQRALPVVPCQLIILGLQLVPCTI